MICSVCGADDNLDNSVVIDERSTTFGPSYVACTVCDNELTIQLLRCPEHTRYAMACSRVNMLDSLRSFTVHDYLNYAKERVECHLAMLTAFEQLIDKMRLDKQASNEDDDSGEDWGTRNRRSA